MGGTTQRRSTLRAVVLCALLVGAALAVGTGPAAAQVALTGDVRTTPSGGLVVTVEERTGENVSGPFTGESEQITIKVAGASISPPAAAPGNNSSTYTYSVPRGTLADTKGFSTTNLSNAKVTVIHPDSGSNFTERVDLRYLRFGEQSGRFTDDGRLRVGFQVAIGLAPDENIPLSVDTGDGTQSVTGTYQRDTGAGTSYVVLDRNALKNIGVLDDPGTITISGRNSYVSNSVTVNVTSIAQTTGQRLTEGVRFTNPLLVNNRTYAVTVQSSNGQYLARVTADGTNLDIESSALFAETKVTLTVDRNGKTVIGGQSIKFRSKLQAVTGNVTADGATITLDSLGDRSGNVTADGATITLDSLGDRSGNVTALWIQTADGVERYAASLNESARTLTLSGVDSFPSDSNQTALLVEFEQGAALYATVQTDGGGQTTAPKGDGTGGQGLFSVLSGIPDLFLLVGGAFIGMIVVAGITVVILRQRGSGSTKLSLPFIGSSNTRSTGDSPGESPGVKTVTANFEAVDSETGETYHDASQVIARRSQRQGRTDSRGLGAGANTGSANRTTQGVNTDDTERINLTAGAGEAELRYGSWHFEVKENGRTIAEREHELKYDNEGIRLPVDPYTVDVQVTGGREREPLERATVTVSTDADRKTRQTRTDPNGRARFEIPRSASALTFTAEYEELPQIEEEYDAERAAEEGVTLEIAPETGSIAVETVVGSRSWPGVEVRITPISEDAKAYTDEGTVTTDDEGRREVTNLPTGEYEVSAHPQAGDIETTGGVERATVEENATKEVTLSIEISFSLSTAQRERLAELRDRIDELTAASNRDVAIPRYYGTVLTSVLDLAEAVEAAPERAVEVGVPPGATVDALLEATDAGINAVDGAMSERRNIKLFRACESMPDAQVEWDGDATLEEFFERVREGGDHERRALRDRLKETDELLDEKWSDVGEIGPARKLHDRIGDLARQSGDLDDDLVIVAQAYVGICLLDAIESIFEHDALRERLDSGSY